MGGYRLASYQAANGPRAGIIIGESIFDAAARPAPWSSRFVRSA